MKSFKEYLNEQATWPTNMPTKEVIPPFPVNPKLKGTNWWNYKHWDIFDDYWWDGNAGPSEIQRWLQSPIVYPKPTHVPGGGVRGKHTPLGYGDKVPDGIGPPL